MIEQNNSFEAPDTQESPVPTCPMCEYEGKPCPGGAHAFALHEDGIHTVEDYKKMKAATPVPREETGCGECGHEIEVHDYDQGCQHGGSWNQFCGCLKYSPPHVPDTPGAIPLPDVLRRLRMAVNEPADSFGDAYGWVEFLRTEILATIRALATQGKQEGGLRSRIGVLEAALLARDLLISDMYGYMEHDMTPEADGIFMAAREVIDALATQGKQE